MLSFQVANGKWQMANGNTEVFLLNTIVSYYERGSRGQGWVLFTFYGKQNVQKDDGNDFIIGPHGMHRAYGFLFFPHFLHF